MCVAWMSCGQVDVAVTHCGVCHTDISLAFDAWKRSKFPFIPGHEAVGIVTEVGRSVKLVKVGDRVGVGYIRDTCGVCLSCLRGEENICSAGIQGTIEFGGKGGWANVVRAKAKFVFPIPDQLSSLDAAPLLCAGVTVYSPLKAHVTPGCEVCVLGCGGLGHLAVQFASKMGACVTCVDIDPGKAADCMRLGADRHMSLADFLSDNTKFNLVLNSSPMVVDAKKAMGALFPGGTLVQLGIPGAGLTADVPLLETTMLQLQFAGSNVGGRATMMECLQFAGKKGIRPMVEPMPFAQVNEAIERINSGKAHFRIVLVNE